MKQADDQYRRYVAENLDRIIGLLARISFDDFSHRIDVDGLPDDEFAEVFAGLDMLMDDLHEARDRMSEETAFTRMRADIWKNATMDTGAPGELIQGLLQAVGEHVHTTGVSYLEIERDSNDAVCIAEWIPEGETSVLGMRLARALWKHFIGIEWTEITPAQMEAEGQTEFAEMMRRVDAGSSLAASCGDPSDPYGFLVFSDSDEARTWSERERFLLFEIASIISNKVAQARVGEALRKAKDRLEMDVRERTAELRDANRTLEEDIEKIRRTENALRESEELYRTLVETSPDPILLVSPGRKIQMCNRAAFDVFRYACDGIEGRDLLTIAGNRDRELIAEEWKAHLQSSRVATAEHEFVRADGSTFYGECRSSALRDEQGGHRGSLFIIRDITDRRRHEQEMLRAQKLESLGTLAGGLAHDFNNILAGILGNVFIARQNVHDRPEAVQVLEDIEQAANRAKRLTTQFLTFSSGGRPVKEVTSIAEIVENTARFSLSGSPVTFSLELSPDLKPVDIDRGQIEQVLSNLFINAKQAMPDGGTVRIRVENARADARSVEPLSPGDYVRVSIRDTGVGIAPRDLQKVFDPYFTTKEHGSGLGLATAYSIVKKHDGHIRCESGAGKGTTVIFWLPAASRPAAMPNKREQQNTTAPAGAKILIMDDDYAVRLVMEKLLQGAGCTTKAVVDGRDALGAYREAKNSEAPFDLVIMDLTIAGGSGGKETIRELLEFDPSARAIVVSGYSNDPIMSNYREHGFKGVVPKPFEVKQFIEVVISVLGE